MVFVVYPHLAFFPFPFVLALSAFANCELHSHTFRSFLAVVHVTTVQHTMAMLKTLYTSRSEPFVLGSLGSPEQSLFALTKGVRADHLLNSITIIGTQTNAVLVWLTAIFPPPPPFLPGTSEDAEDGQLSPLIIAGLTAFVASPISKLQAKTLWTVRSMVLF